jgi:hypothetical protein
MVEIVRHGSVPTRNCVVEVDGFRRDARRKLISLGNPQVAHIRRYLRIWIWIQKKSLCQISDNPILRLWKQFPLHAVHQSPSLGLWKQSGFFVHSADGDAPRNHLSAGRPGYRLSILAQGRQAQIHSYPIKDVEWRRPREGLGLRRALSAPPPLPPPRCLPGLQGAGQEVNLGAHQSAPP